jgi:hypothetical protein
MSETLANELALPLTEKKVGNDVRLATEIKFVANFVRFLPIGPFSEIENIPTLAATTQFRRPCLKRINPDVDWLNNRIRRP